MLGFGFIFISRLRAAARADRLLITEAFYIRRLLIYAIGGGLAGSPCYLAFVPFDTDAMRFTGIVRRHLEVMAGAGIVGGLVYWMIAGRNAGVWRRPRRYVPPAAIAVRVAAR